MLNNQHDEQNKEEEYTFIEEKVESRRKQRVKKIVYAVILTIVLGGLFGLTAGVVLCVSEEPLYSMFGKNKNHLEFSLGEDISESDSKETHEDNIETSPSSTEKTHTTIINNTVDASLDDIEGIYDEVKGLADQAAKAMVLVTSIKSNQDWFQNEIEVPDDTIGLIVGNNGVDILVLVNYNLVKGASTIKVAFNNDIKTEAKLQSFDSEINLAIIAIPLSVLPQEVREIEPASLGESSYLPLGTPIIAVGSPNGYMDSMEIGMVTSKGTKAYITDYQIDLYHTDISYVKDGEGYILNLRGNIIGIITNYLSDSRGGAINTFIGISSIKPMIESLVNDESRAYLGITAIDITDDALEELNLENGIAVTAVEANSPAFKGGIQIGDIITSVNDENILSVKNFQSRLLKAKPEDMVDIELYREYQNTSDLIEIETKLETRRF